MKFTLRDSNYKFVHVDKLNDDYWIEPPEVIIWYGKIYTRKLNERNGRDEYFELEESEFVLIKSRLEAEGMIPNKNNEEKTD